MNPCLHETAPVIPPIGIRHPPSMAPAKRGASTTCSIRHRSGGQSPADGSDPCPSGPVGTRLRRCHFGQPPCSASASYRFTCANRATLKLFGAKDEAEFVALSPWDLSPEIQPDGRTSAEKAGEMIETAMRDGSHFFEWIHRRLSGEDFPASVLLTRIEMDGRVQLQATVRDITEQKQAEEELRQAKQARGRPIGQRRFIARSRGSPQGPRYNHLLPEDIPQPGPRACPRVLRCRIPLP